MELWRRIEAGSPLLIDVPHAGTYLPPDMAARLTPEALALPDTDWHVDRLFSFAERIGAGFLAATHSRYVIDLNRDPEGRLLYPGSDNTELVPLTRFDWQPIYRDGQAPDNAEVAQRIETFWKPYHARLSADIDAIVKRFGHCVLLDGHSIPHSVPRFFEGRLPDLNLGSSEGKSAGPDFCDAAWRVLEGQGQYSSVRDGRFTGGHITRHYGRPEQGVHALQIEIVQDVYMDEAQPHDFAEEKAQNVISILERMAKALLAVRR